MPAATHNFFSAEADCYLCRFRRSAKEGRVFLMRFSPTPWFVASLAFVVLGFSRGIHSSFGVFNVALLDAFGWSRGATAGIFSIVLTVDAVLSPLVCYLLDRYGTKKISIAGCFALVLGLFLSSQVSALWQLYICFGIVLAVGFTFTGMVPHVFLVSEWFSSNRASAIGFVYAGTGLGIMLLAPLSEWLISRFGWTRAFEIYAATALIGLLPVVWLFYRHGPYGQHAHRRAEKKDEANQWTARLALQSLKFWLLFVARIAVVWLFYRHGPYGQHAHRRAEKKDEANQWTARLALQSLKFWLLFVARIA